VAHNCRLIHSTDYSKVIPDGPLAPLAQFDGQLLEGLEFCGKVYALFESIRAEDDGKSRLRMLASPLEKKLLEELLPICRYVQASYRAGRYISVCWVYGNQGFDARIQQRGSYVSQDFYPAEAYLEVTCAMHPNDHLGRHKLDQDGYAFGLNGLSRVKGKIESVPSGYSNHEFVEEYRKFLLEEIAKKAQKTYPENTTLIVRCTLNLPYTRDEWEMLVASVRASLPSTSFDEIYLHDPQGQHEHRIYPKHNG
jgi:hypothetical protein